MIIIILTIRMLIRDKITNTILIIVFNFWNYKYVIFKSNFNSLINQTYNNSNIKFR